MGNASVNPPAVTVKHQQTVMKQPPPDYMDESVVVNTIAGAAVGWYRGSADGIGRAAGFDEPSDLIHWPAGGDALLISEVGSNRIRCLFPATEQREAALHRTLTSVLFESGSLPVKPLVLIIRDFAMPNSMCWVWSAERRMALAHGNDIRVVRCVVINQIK